eukprot:6049261-Pyramimonas_sp.AAC.1
MAGNELIEGLDTIDANEYIIKDIARGQARRGEVGHRSILGTQPQQPRAPPIIICRLHNRSINAII